MLSFIALALFLSNAMFPRGIRNNNPCNLRPMSNGDKWTGQTAIQDDFVIFDYVENGYRAAALNLFHYWEKDGVKTIYEMAERWAPRNDNNDPVGYAQTVAAYAGVNPSEQLSLIDLTSVMPRILRGMTYAENGINIWPDSIIERGYKLALTYRS